MLRKFENEDVQQIWFWRGLGYLSSYLLFMKPISAKKDYQLFSFGLHVVFLNTCFVREMLAMMEA
jgi:hypothetical protein